MQHPTPSSDANYTTVPLGVQQFYQLAQQHAAVNSTYPTATPTYLPLTEPEAYAPAMHFSAYNMPQHIGPSAAMEVPTYDAASAWPQFGFGEAVMPMHPASLVAAPSDSWDSKPYMYGHAMATPMGVVQSEEDLPTPHNDSVSAPTNAPAHSAAGSGFPIAATLASSFPSPSQAHNQPHEIISDAPVTDEHKWRKYGQKQVKRSPYPRNYYKCTVSGCPAKKHLEKFWDASVNRERCRTEYIGEHVHPLAVSPQVFASNQQDFQSNVLAQSAKIRASGGSSANDTSSRASLVLTSDATHHYQQQQQQQQHASCNQRLVVECGTQVDENEDGYVWRKYGQKSVKGSSVPRQYYRCRILNCPVKKTVEAAPSGNTIVTYDGCHSHEPGVHSDSHPNSPSSLPPTTVNGAAHTPVNIPPLRICIKREAPSASSVNTYYSSSSPSSSFSSDVYSHLVESPSSSFSTTDEDEYLSESSPKRIFAPDSSYYAAEQQVHQYLPEAGSVDAWFASWE